MTLESALFLLLDIGVKATVLLGLVVSSVFVVAHHRPALRALLWNHAFVALLILPIASLLLPAWRLPILPSDRFESVFTALQEPSALHQVPEPVSVPPISPSESFSSPIPSSEPIPVTPIVFVQPAWTKPSWSEVILGIYCFGVGIGLFRLLLGWWRVHVLRSQVHRFAGVDLMVRLDRWRKCLGVGDRVDIGISNKIRVPTVVGVFRPLIIVPADIVAKGTDADWDGILIHELAHVKRCDTLWNVVGMLISALYWYHPLMHWARYDLANTREYACDDWAVAALGNANAYATTLLEVTAHTDRKLSQALGLDMARTSRVLYRVNRVLGLGAHTLPHMGRLTSGVVLLVMLTSAGLLGSLHPVSEDGSTRSSVLATHGDEAADWVRRQYFLYDYVAGYREGEKLVAQFPDHAELKAWYVLNLFAENHDAGRQVLDTMPNGDVWTDFARAFVWRTERKKEALQLSERVWMSRPDDPDFLWLRAQVLWKAEGEDAALAFFDRQTERVQNSAELLALKGNIMAYPARSAQVLTRQQEQMAFDAFKEAQRMDPGNVSAYYWPGVLLWRMQRPAEAYPLIKNAARLSPHARQIHSGYWNIVFDMPNWHLGLKRVEIEADMDLFLKGRENDPELLSTVAMSLDSKLDQQEKLRVVSHRILETFPNTPEAERELVRQFQALQAQMHRDTSNLELREKYRAALWAYVNRPTHHDTRLLGTAYSWLFHEVKTDAHAKPEDLLRVAQGLVQYNPSHLFKVFCDGPIMLVERTSYFRKAEAIARQGFDAAKNLANRHQDQDESGIERYQTVQNVTAGVHDALGWIYFQEGRFVEAEQELLKAYELYPDPWRNLYHLSQLETHRGDWERAESFYIQALMLNKGNNFFLENGLRDLYQKRYGFLNGFDAYLAAIHKDVVIHRKKYVLANRAKLPNPMPDFLFECLDGSVISLSALRGKVVVLDVRRSASAGGLDFVQKIHERFATRDDVVVLHVNTDSKLNDVAQQGRYGFPMAMGSAFVQKTNIKRPTMWLIDRQGNIAYQANDGLRDMIWRVEGLVEER